MTVREQTTTYNHLSHCAVCGPSKLGFNRGQAFFFMEK